jgi:hypothetical protein
MKTPIQLLKNIKYTPKLIIGVSLVVVALATFTTLGITKYNADRLTTTKAHEEAKEKQKLDGISDITTNNKDAQNQPAAPGQSPSGTTDTGSSPAAKPGTSPRPTPNTSAPSTGGGNNTAPAPAAPPVSTSPADNDTPHVTLTYPSVWGQTVSGVITMTATASDATSGIQRVVFMIRKIGVATAVYTSTDTSAPYSAAFDTTTLPNGGSDYTVEAQAFDGAGTGNLDSLRINIQN